MYEISSEIYEKAALKLCDEMDDNGYYSGVINFTHGDAECRMVVSLIIYHKQVEMPEGRFVQIEDIVPVWWEFHTLIDGVERINDFDFATFKEFVVHS